MTTILWIERIILIIISISLIINFGPALIIIVTMFITIIIDMMIKTMKSRMIGGIEGIEEICASLGLGKVPLLNADDRLDKIRFISTGCFFFTGTPLKS